MKKTINLLSLFVLASSMSVMANEDVARELVQRYSTIAKMEDAKYAGPSADEGRAFFNREVIQFKGASKKSVKAISCATCHTSNPADIGKHIVTGKKIKPLSPIANPKRFDDIEKVENQFNKHCHEVVGSDCTAAEKANYIAFLIEDKSPSVIKK